METNAILDTSVLMHEKKGTTTILSVVEYPKAAGYDIEILWPDKKDFTDAVEIAALLYAKGAPIPAIDVLIAAMCLNRQRVLKTKDRHFAAIQAVRPDFRVATT